MDTSVNFGKAKSADISLASVVVDPTFNCRGSVDAGIGDAKLENLSESMNASGQLTPIVVERREGVGKDKGEVKYYLLSGFRRVSVAQKLGWDKIAARVFEPMNEQQRLLINLIENSARDNLTTWDIANACFKLSGTGLDSKEIGLKIGRSDSYVRNLVNGIKNVHPMIKDRWRRECDPVEKQKLTGVVCSTDWLNEINDLRDDKQLEAYEKRRGEKIKKPGKDQSVDPDYLPSASQAGAGKEGSIEGDKPEVKVKSKNRTALETAKTAVLAKMNASKDDTDKRKLEVSFDTLRWALGFIEEIPGVYNPEVDKVEVTG